MKVVKFNFGEYLWLRPIDSDIFDLPSEKMRYVCAKYLQLLALINIII